MLQQRCHRGVLAAVKGPLILPDHKSRPTRDPGRRARRPAPQPAGGAPTPASGSARRRRSRPRSAHPRPPANRPAPAAAPATSPDPDDPRWTPGRRTRTAAHRAHAPPPGHGQCTPPTTPAHPRVRCEPHLPGTAGSFPHRSQANAAGPGPARPGPNVAAIESGRTWQNDSTSGYRTTAAYPAIRSARRHGGHHPTPAIRPCQGAQDRRLYKSPPCQFMNCYHPHNAESVRRCDAIGRTRLVDPVHRFCVDGQARPSRLGLSR